MYLPKIISLGSRLIACCKLPPTLARQMWRHNYVINRNEYLIFTLSESINPLNFKIQCNFCLNPQIIYGDMKENVSGCFFSEHSVDYAFRMNVMEEIFEFRSWIKILWRVLTKSIQLISIRCTVNRELQGIHTGGSSSFRRYEWVKYVWPILRQL